MISLGQGYVIGSDSIIGSMMAEKFMVIIFSHTGLRQVTLGEKSWLTG